MAEEKPNERLPRLIRRRTLDVTVDVKPAPVDLAADLHKAKEEVARELEANLKQLKEVLRETEQIAKDMELVLHQAKAPVDDDHHQKDDAPEDDDDPTLTWGPNQDENEEEWDPLENG